MSTSTYLKLFAELLAARAAGGGTLSMEEESQRAEVLEDAWNKLTEEEQAVVEAEVERSKVPTAPIDLGLVDVVVSSGSRQLPREKAKDGG